jgi:mRNA interferase RelE/StbE
MAWKIEFAPEAAKELGKLDPVIARRINSFLKDRIEPSVNPRSFGEALKGSKLGEFWKYRVGDYRIVCNIEDTTITVYVVRIGHRREIYR